MWLVSDQGEAVRGRCRATNQCAYCARLAAVENSELLALDALAGDAPTVWAVLTTRSADPVPASFYRSRELVMRAIRRRWPAAEYAALVEFTTGYGPLAGGRRRPHWNLLIKGVPAEDVDQVGDVIRRVWCEREDAEPWAQHVGAISEAGGLMRYIALHFQKEEQAPPAGWRGHRFLKSRGYLAVSTPEAREQARASLRHKRELWRAIKSGASALEAELQAHEAMERAAATSWELVHVTPAAELPALPEQREAGLAADVAVYDRVSRWAAGGGAEPFEACAEAVRRLESRSRGNRAVASAPEPSRPGRTTPYLLSAAVAPAAAAAPPPRVSGPAHALPSVAVGVG
jgi:hypothetical protein